MKDLREFNEKLNELVKVESNKYRGDLYFYDGFLMEGRESLRDMHE